MIKNLTPIGDHLGLIIDQQLLDLLHIDRETPLEVVVEGGGLHASARGRRAGDGHP
jgi:hypothetical protein